MNHLINMLGQPASFMEKNFSSDRCVTPNPKITSKCLKDSNAWEKTFRTW